ncbi:MAG: hypothetical protein IKS18_07485 [Lachnospiraceae bacterium]|nr:hypothetical protein [Lachnospiraceae bacterium]
MKKILILLSMLLLLSAVSACTGKQEETTSAEPESTSAESTASTTKEETTAEEKTETEGPTDEETYTEIEPEPDLLPEAAFYGGWYARVKNMAFLLTLSEDGSYAAGFPALPGDPETGTWKYADGMIYLNESEDFPILVLGEDLLQADHLDALFSREVIEDYTPGELITETELQEFSGYWISTFVVQGDAILPAENLQDDTDIYIEGTNVALGGSLFGDVIREFVYEENALVFTQSDEAGNSMTVKLELLDDGFMRMSVSAPDLEDLVVYLQYEGGEELLTEKDLVLPDDSEEDDEDDSEVEE